MTSTTRTLRISVLAIFLIGGSLSFTMNPASAEPINAAVTCTEVVLQLTPVDGALAISVPSTDMDCTGARWRNANDKYAGKYLTNVTGTFDIDAACGGAEGGGTVSLFGYEPDDAPGQASVRLTLVPVKFQTDLVAPLGTFVHVEAIDTSDPQNGAVAIRGVFRQTAGVCLGSATWEGTLTYGDPVAPDINEQLEPFGIQI